MILPELVLPAAYRIQKLANAAARFQLSQSTCVRRSLAPSWMLTSLDIDANLRLGVLKGTAGLQAQAWLEIDGCPLGEPEAIIENFQVLSH